MTTITLLPLFNEYDFSYSSSLNGISVNLRFIWNTRTLHHHLTVSLKDGAVVVDGVKLVRGYPIQTSAMYENGLEGVFFFTPLSDSIEDNSDTRLKCADNFVFSYST